MTHLKELILIGAGGHARSCIEVIESEAKFRIAGIVGLNEEIGKKIDGYEVIATDLELKELAKNYRYAIVAIGQIHTSEKREAFFVNAKKAGFLMATVIAPTAYVSSRSEVKDGTIIMHNVIVNSGVLIGENCIINSAALIEHDSRIEDHCHISTGVLVNGNVSIKKGSFIGSGSVIKEGISIGRKSLIGMCSSVRYDLKSNSVFYGEDK